MARYRTHSVAHILQVVQAHPAGETRPRLALLSSESMLILVAMLLASHLGSASRAVPAYVATPKSLS
jgi:hypothetical protein